MPLNKETKPIIFKQLFLTQRWDPKIYNHSGSEWIQEYSTLPKYPRQDLHH